MKKLLFCILFLCLTAAQVYANPFKSIPYEKAKADIKKVLVERYAPNYSTVEMLLEQSMEAFDYLKKLPATKINTKILTDLHKRYHPNFLTIKTLYESNIESYNRLK